MSGKGMNFDEHWKERCITSNCDKDECKNHFEAGAQSRQAEIDALSALGEMSEQKIDDLVKRNTKLQKQIDEALEILEYNEYTDSYLQAIDILKGKENE